MDADVIVAGAGLAGLVAACDIADKYMLPGLQSSAVVEFKECMFQMWEQGTPYDPTSAFAEVVERVYEDPRDLWDDPLKQALRIAATGGDDEALAAALAETEASCEGESESRSA